MERKYVPLHIHSHYSILDGYATVDEYIETAKEMGLPGLGLSDHGSASGLYKFINGCKKAGITPVPGVEFYVAPKNPEGARAQSPVYYGKGGKKAEKYDVSSGAYTHMTVFAKNNKGLENLFKLTSLSWLPEHYYFKPRIDINMLAEHSEGLIVTTGCPSSDINRRFLLGQDEEAYELANRLKSIFKDDLYVEIMDHKMEDEELENILIPKQIELARKLGIKMIGTNDSHYAKKEDSDPHERILAVSTKTTMKEKTKAQGGKRFAFSGPEYHIKTYDEMLALYPEDIAEELLENTVELMGKCDVSLNYDPNLRPEIDIPEGYSPATYLQKLIYEGFEKKRGNDCKEIQEESVKRIQEEFEVLHSNDFLDYFLVVEDYIRFAHENNIAVGAGRGCFEAGNLVSTKTGKKAIENIEIGDEVLTHDNTYQKVEDKFIYEVEDENMTEIMLDNGKVIKATADHLIFDKDKGFIRADEFRSGDEILGPSDLRDRPREYTKSKGDIISGSFESHRFSKKTFEYKSTAELKALLRLETDSEVEDIEELDEVRLESSAGKKLPLINANYKVKLRNGIEVIVDVREQADSEDSEIKQTLAKLGYEYEIWTEEMLDKLSLELNYGVYVQSVENYKFTGKVYDLQVANVHNYNVSDITVHNSVGGSEIAYVLDISDTDPIRFNLLFERFLSPGRGSLYQIEYVTGEVEEISVSSKKRIMTADGTSEVVYVHELSPGDAVNYEDKNLVIDDIFVKVPGSAPDVDTDFHTEGREKVVEYCVEKYGQENVSNIVSFGTFKAKKSFKTMCTAYSVPFALANKISSYIPGEPGNEATLNELMDPTSSKYNEGRDFREALEERPELSEVVEMALRLDGRISDTSVHPCGVIIAKRPLAGLIPLQVRQDDNKSIAQWEYPELESLGLIKMDFLGLDLLNTIQKTLDNINLVNETARNPEDKKEIPNLRQLIQGKLDDKETFEMLQNGHTVGIFQLSSPGVRDLLVRAKPTSFMEIANITALYRPGPMKSGAHIQYADRKAGREEVSYIHDDFIGTEVQEILEETYGLLIFQEQIMLIAGKYAGMTPYETDKLRSAIGKKKMKVMMEMKPKFIEGCLARGCSQGAVDTLWEAIEVFGQYGFNKSHSVSYALNIYQSMYLKTHHPKEFMAALIQQSFGSPKKLQEYIQEAQRMKLRVGAVDINTSQVEMASSGNNPDSEFDIVFGFSGVKQTNDKFAEIVVEERNKNGDYKSVADFVKRVSKVTNITASPLSQLALAGAFDCFGVSRKQVSEKAKKIIDSCSPKKDQGTSLLDMMGGGQGVTENIELTGERHPFNEMIKLEAKAIGLFVSGHPTSRLGHIAKRYKPTELYKILSSGGGRELYTVMGTITMLKSKTSKTGKRSIAVLLDDGTATASCYLPKAIVARIEKYEELEKKEKAESKGLKYTPKTEHLAEIMENEDILPLVPLELYDPYMFTMKTTGYEENVKAVIVDIKLLETAPDGSLPYEINAQKSQLNEIKRVLEKHKDRKGAFVKINVDNKSDIAKIRVKLSLDFIIDMENVVGKENIVTEGI